MRRVEIKGMSCQHCVQAVTQALQQLEGISKVDVSLEQGEARYEEENPVDRDTVRDAVRKAGYEAGEFQE